MFFVKVTSTDGTVRYIPVLAPTADQARQAVINSGMLRPRDIISDTAGRAFFDARGEGNFLPTETQARNTALNASRPNIGGGDPSDFDPAEPPRLPVDTGAAGEGNFGQQRPIRASEEFEFGPAFEAGLRDRGINIGPGGGTIGSLAAQQFNPLRSRAFVSTAFNAPGGAFDPNATPEEVAGPTFQEFVRTGNILGSGAAQSARALLEQARGFGSQFENAGLLGANIINPATSQQGIDLANVAREAARQRFGSFARFLPNSQQLSQSFFAQPAGTQETFADFLNRRIFG